MQIGQEFLRIGLVLFITTLLVSFLTQAPVFLALLLLLPLGLAVWFWPHSSTALSYLVGAIVGTLFTAWSFIQSVDAPTGLFPLAYLWLPLVWGPAGVVVKRLEILVVEIYRRASGNEELPRL